MLCYDATVVEDIVIRVRNLKAMFLVCIAFKVSVANGFELNNNKNNNEKNIFILFCGIYCCLGEAETQRVSHKVQ